MISVHDTVFRKFLLSGAASAHPVLNVLGDYTNTCSSSKTRTIKDKDPTWVEPLTLEGGTWLPLGHSEVCDGAQIITGTWGTFNRSQLRRVPQPSPERHHRVHTRIR